MPAATPTIGLGTTFAIESATPGTYTLLGDIIAIQPFDAQMPVMDTTDFSNTDGIRRKNLAGLIEVQPASITIKYDGESDTYTTLRTQFFTRTAKNYKMVEPGLSHEVVNAFITNIGREIPLDEMMTCTIEFTPTATITRTVV